MADVKIDRTLRTYSAPGLPRETYEIDKDTGLPKKVTKLYEKQININKGKL